MINVKFFGVLRLDLKSQGIKIEAKDVRELLKKISIEYKNISYKYLSNSIIFVNGIDIINLKGLKTSLKAGDEVEFFSPVSGG